MCNKKLEVRNCCGREFLPIITFVYQKFLIPTFDTSFLTTNIHLQFSTCPPNSKDIGNRKTGLKLGFERFLMYIYKESSDMFRNESDAKIYTFALPKVISNSFCTPIIFKIRLIVYFNKKYTSFNLCRPYFLFEKLDAIVL